MAQTFKKSEIYYINKDIVISSKPKEIQVSVFKGAPLRYKGKEVKNDVTYYSFECASLPLLLTLEEKDINCIVLTSEA